MLINKECLINNEKHLYDVCDSGTKEEADERYKDKYNYVGSSDTAFINGREWKIGELTHFYVLKDTKYQINEQDSIDRSQQYDLEHPRLSFINPKNLL